MNEAESKRWLRCYPPSWRERYGDELAAHLDAMSADGRFGWAAKLDVLRAAARERLRGAGDEGDGSAAGRTRAGVLLVLCAWALFMVGGTIFQRFSENWSAFTPVVDRTLPAVAYDVLAATAVLAGLLVLAGIALAVPATAAFLRRGGLRTVRAPLAIALICSAAALAAFVAVEKWALTLAPTQRNGGDVAYGIAFLTLGVVAVLALGAWTALAVRLARLVDLPARTLRLERLLAVAVAACMGLVTVGVAVWWFALARTAPWALQALPVGSTASAVSVQLLFAGVLMTLALLIAVLGVALARPRSGPLKRSL